MREQRNQEHIKDRTEREAYEVQNPYRRSRLRE